MPPHLKHLATLPCKS